MQKELDALVREVLPLDRGAIRPQRPALTPADGTLQPVP